MATLTMAASDRLSNQISNFDSEVQQLTRRMSLREISVPMFSVTDPLGRSIPISLAHCGDFNALDGILKACLHNQPEAGAQYVEDGDYNIVSPVGTIVLRIEFSQIVRAGMQFDMSIVKRRQLEGPPNMERCPYCHRNNSKVPGNAWIHCSHPQCGRRYQISVQEVEGSVGEIYSPQLTGRKKDPTITQERENIDLFRLVQIQAVYERKSKSHEKVLADFVSLIVSGNKSTERILQQKLEEIMKTGGMTHEAMFKKLQAIQVEQVRLRAAAGPK
ncbi:hypothetical protein B0H14DRAFT_720029 [Mycena olivaceomarginata]|nr:hypothetical protein B0H14DRAFT_720029 [Mycena olivaceomarginata]